VAGAEGLGVLRLRLQAVARGRRDGRAAAARVREDHVPGLAQAGEVVRAEEPVAVGGLGVLFLSTYHSFCISAAALEL